MPALSEKIIQIDEDREVRLLFNNRALAEAEQAIGTPIAGWREETMGISQMAYLLRAGMEAARRRGGGGRPVTMAAAYAVMDAVGFTAVTIQMMEAVADVLSFGASTGSPSTGSGTGEEDGDDPF